MLSRGKGKLEGTNSNTAYYSGGALYSEYSIVSVEGDGKFNSSLSSRGHISFTNNLANVSGGASVSSSSVNLEGDISFVNNTAY